MANATDATTSLARDRRTVFDAREYEAVNVPLSELLVDGRLHLYPEVTGKDYFRFHLKDDALVFQAGGFVGLIPVNDRVAIDVRPRVPISNLDRLLYLAEYAPVLVDRHWRYYAVGEQLHPSILDLLARALLRAVEQVDAEGLYREYRRVTEDTSAPRGRIQLSTTARLHARGMSHRVSAIWFEHSVDNAPNRCLRYAIWYLARRYQSITNRAGSRRIIAGLNKADHMLTAVKIDETRRFFEDRLVQFPNEFPMSHVSYSDAIPIARAIIRDKGITFDGRRDEILMGSLVLNLDDIFERYLRAILRAAFIARQSQFDVLDGNASGALGGRKRLFEWQGSGAQMDATPDVVVARKEQVSACPLIVEVKYKPIQGMPDRADLNQVIAYAISYHAPAVVLVHPRADPLAPRCYMLGRVQSVAVFIYAFDLQTSELVDEEAAFVSMMHWLSEGAAQ